MKSSERRPNLRDDDTNEGLLEKTGRGPDGDISDGDNQMVI